MNLDEIFDWQDVTFKIVGRNLRDPDQQKVIDFREMTIPHFHLGWEFKLMPEHKLEVIPPFALHESTIRRIAAWVLRGKELFFYADNFKEARVIDDPGITGALAGLMELCGNYSTTIGKEGMNSLLSAAWQLLLKSIKSTEDFRFSAKPAGICDIVIDYLESNYSRQDLSVEEIADYTGYSAQYINRKFCEHKLGSLRQFLVKMRLRHAAVLLGSGCCSVGTAAQLTGWSNQFYFSNAFRKFYGVSPSKFADFSGAPEK